MARISLRAYNREVESLIENGRIDEAIAHCRHILQFFPKHIDTYRLLGKAYLESQRYSDAADILQRVLSSVPEDFVSHVGMSIIREDEGNLDEAIWHMERAFEVQPANSAIQEELRRLFGRRDGIEPPKIRLTRGALARMYAKGELFQQAISELRAALNEDPLRLDLQSLLAQVFTKAGSKAEAVDACNALLRKLPFCLEANRIMAQVLANTERAEEMRTFRQRVQSMDPYFAHTSAAIPDTENVPDQAVSLEKLVWRPGEAARSGQPEWAASLGVKLTETTSETEKLPDWLNELEAEPDTATKAPVISPFEEEPVQETIDETSSETGEERLRGDVPDWLFGEEKPAEQQKDQIPDWMKEAGWGPSTGEVDESQLTSSGEGIAEGEPLPSDLDLPQADIPDWLQAIAPAEEPPETQPGADLTSSDWFIEGSQEQPVEDELELPTWEATTGIPDWLKELEQPSSSPQELAQAELPEVEEEQEMPGWMQTKAEAGEAAALERFPSAEEPAETGGELLPDWLHEAERPEAAEGVESEEISPHEEMPDWLKEFGQPEAVEDIPSKGEEPATAPDWLHDLGETQVSEPGATQIAEPSEEIEAQTIETPEWLKDLGPGPQEMGAEESQEAGLLAKAEPGELPDWLKELKPTTEEPAEPFTAAPFEGEIAAGPATPEPEQGAADLDWLVSAASDLGAGAGAQDEHPEALLDWLGEAALEGEAGPTPEEETEEGEGPEILEEMEMPGWLEEMKASQVETPEAIEPSEFLAEAEEPGEAPDWLRETEQQVQPGAEGAEVAPITGLPEWLEEAEVFEGDQGVKDLEVQPQEGELPDWLRAMQPASTEELFQEPPGRVKGETVEGDEQPTEIQTAKAEDWLPEPELSAIQAAEPETALAQPEEARSEVEPVEEPAQKPEEEPAFDIQDSEAAFAWLESLAVKHGADEALLLKPEERSETPPEWVQAAARQGESDAEETTDQVAESQEVDQGEMASKPEGEWPDWLPEEDAESIAPEMAIEDHLAEPEEAPTQPVEEIPDWLLAVEEGVPAEGDTQPTRVQAIQAEDWVPEAEQPGEAQAQPGEETTPVEQTPEGEPAFDIQDSEAAFAWLESLAVKQGADEALLLSPEERLETPPEWVREAAGQEEVEQPVPAPEEQIEPSGAGEPLPPAETITGEAREAGLPVAEEIEQGEPAEGSVMEDMLFALREVQTLEAQVEEAQAPSEEPAAEAPATAEPSSPEEAADSAFAWLESLAVKQGAEEALLLSPEERLETPPEWVIQESAEVEVEAVEFAETPAAEAQEPAPVQEPEEQPEQVDWLKDLEQQEAVEEYVPTSPVETEAPAVEVGPAELAEEELQEEEIPDLPDWLAGAVSETEEAVWAPPKLNLNQASLAELERVPDIGFRLAQKIVAYREVHGWFTNLDDLNAISEITPSMLESLQDYLYVELPPAPATGQLKPEIREEPAPPEPPAESAEEIKQAYQMMGAGDVQGAIGIFQGLIKSRQHLTQVISSLNEASLLHPDEISLWQTLGDAYLRDNQLQNALQAYTRAEQLLL